MALLALLFAVGRAVAADEVGTFWTQNLDCVYNNPPPELTIRNPAFSCEEHTKNVKILKSGKDYYVPRGASKNEAPFCLVPAKGRAGTSVQLQAARESQYIYCVKKWSWWERLLWEIGLL